MANIKTWLRESQALSKQERHIIESVAIVESCEEIQSMRYDPMFAYGSERVERWRVTYQDGRTGWLVTWSWGNTDGCGLDILAQDWDGICVACGHDFFRDCLGNCTCLSCNIQAQSMLSKHKYPFPLPNPIPIED